MRALWGTHITTSHRRGVPARWRRAGGAIAAVSLPMASSGVAAAPAWAAGGCRVTHTIPVSGTPYEVAVDPGTHTAYVTNYSGGTVSVINEATNKVIHTIPVGDFPFGVAVDAVAHTAYVTNGLGTVSVINEATSRVTATVPVGNFPYGVAVDPATHTAYVANADSDTVSVIQMCQ
jgi:YVTN family beta-propeller protein